jgi:hypothetical protein
MEPVPAGPFDPFFLGYETEPDMDYAGRTVMSLQSAVSRGFGKVFKAQNRRLLPRPAARRRGLLRARFEDCLVGSSGKVRPRTGDGARPRVDTKALRRAHQMQAQQRYWT